MGRQLSVAEMAKIRVEYYVIQTLETFEDGVKIFFSLIPVKWVDSKGIDQITLECNFLFPHPDGTKKKQSLASHQVGSTSLLSVIYTHCQNGWSILVK